MPTASRGALLVALILSGCGADPPPPALAPAPLPPPAPPAASATTPQPSSSSASSSPALADSVSPPAASAPQGASAQPAPDPDQPPVEAAPGSVDPEVARQTIVRGIRNVGRGRYEVTAEAMDLLLDQTLQAPRGRSSLRAVPVRRASEVVGIRLQGIRAGDPFAALGLEDGDVIQKVAGLSLASPDSALEAYARMRQAPSLTVDLERKGKKVSLTYQIIRK